MKPPARLSPFALLSITGLLLEASLWGMVRLGNLRQHITPFLALYLAAFVPYLLALWAMRASEAADTSPTPTLPHSLSLILAFAFLFRVTLFFTTPPTLSDDVYRYLWDGRVFNAGLNPYTHPQTATPYPPLAEVLFGFVYALWPENPLAMQATITLFDLLTIGAIVLLLRRVGLPLERVVVYAWNPLVVVEFAHGAHVDAVMLFWMVLALLWLVAVEYPPVERPLPATGIAALDEEAYTVPGGVVLTVSAVCLAAAVLTKLMPLVLWPVFVWRWGWRRTALCGAIVGLAFVPFLGAGLGWGAASSGAGLLGALGIHARQRNFNSGLYHWTEAGLRWLGVGPAGPVATLIMLASMAVVALHVFRKHKKRPAGPFVVIGDATLLVGAYLLLTTTVHPWYVAAIVPLLCFFGSRNGRDTSQALRPVALAPWLYFTAAVALSYLTYLRPAEFRELSWVRWVEYPPLWAGLLAAKVFPIIQRRR